MSPACSPACVDYRPFSRSVVRSKIHAATRWRVRRRRQRMCLHTPERARAFRSHRRLWRKRQTPIGQHQIGSSCPRRRRRILDAVFRQLSFGIQVLQPSYCTPPSSQRDLHGWCPCSRGSRVYLYHSPSRSTSLSGRFSPFPGTDSTRSIFCSSRGSVRRFLT